MSSDPAGATASSQTGVRRRRRPDLHGWAWVLILATAALLFVVGTPVTVNVYGVPLLLSFGVTLAHAATIPLAMRRPMLAVGCAVAFAGVLILLSASADGGVWPWGIPWLLIQLVVIFILGVREPWRVGVLCWGGSIAVSLLAALLMGGVRSHSDATANVVLFASLTGPVLAIAVVLHEWDRIRSQLIRERQVSAEEHSRRTIAEEKARIARELHDVIAHSMSLITVQATSAPYRHPAMKTEVSAEFEEIAASSRQALTEMRRVLAVLRNDEVPGELEPQPGLAEVEALVDQAEKAGLRVSLTWEGTRVDPGPVVGLAAYRILQEALSNAIRHAPEADVAVRCSYTESGMDIRVKNTATASVCHVESSAGLGLVGMRERAHGAGGSVDFGETADGGFEVHAALPFPKTDGRPGR